jgi:hypothetical protein
MEKQAPGANRDALRGQKCLLKEYSTSLRKRPAVKESDHDRMIEEDRYQRFEGRQPGLS